MVCGFCCCCCCIVGVTTPEKKKKSKTQLYCIYITGRAVIIHLALSSSSRFLSSSSSRAWSFTKRTSRKGNKRISSCYTGRRIIDVFSLSASDEKRQVSIYIIQLRDYLAFSFEVEPADSIYSWFLPSALVSKDLMMDHYRQWLYMTTFWLTCWPINKLYRNWKRNIKFVGTDFVKLLKYWLSQLKIKGSCICWLLKGANKYLKKMK